MSSVASTALPLLAPASNHGDGFVLFLLLFAGFGYKMSWSQRELAKRTKKKNKKRMKMSIIDSFAASGRESAQDQADNKPGRGTCVLAFPQGTSCREGAFGATSKEG
jgi:hypothetical protein